MKSGIVQFLTGIALFAVLLSTPAVASERTPSGLSLASPTLEIGFPTQQSLLHFFHVPQDEAEPPNLDVFLTHRTDGGLRTAHLQTLGPEGGAAEIATAFTLDGDGDQRPELFLLARWPIRHSGIGVEGTYFQVFVYRKVAGDDGGVDFERAPAIEARFGSGFDGMQEGERVSFPYKDFESIRAVINP